MQHASSLAVLVNTKPREAKTFQQYVKDNPDCLPILLEQMCISLNTLDNTLSDATSAIQNLTEQVSELQSGRKRQNLTKDDISHYFMENKSFLDNLVFDGCIRLKDTLEELTEEGETNIDILVELEVALKSEPQFTGASVHRATLLTGIKQAFQHIGYQTRLKKSKSKELIQALIVQYISQATTKPRKNIPVKYILAHSGLTKEQLYSLIEELDYEKIQVNRIAHICKKP
jgi:hypothetical protein